LLAIFLLFIFFARHLFFLLVIPAEAGIQLFGVVVALSLTIAL
jgi:hypothetical protein